MSKRKNGRWVGPKRIPLNKIKNRHSPDRVPVARGYDKQPIYVYTEKGFFSTFYRIHDGHKRVRDARAKGKSSIRGYIWQPA